MKKLAVFVISLLRAWLVLGGEAGPSPLTLREAEERALRSHPKITVAELAFLVAKEAVTDARSPMFPSITGSATVVGADGDNTRIAAGGLNNPVIYDRGAFGLGMSWQLFDFGRTANLLDSAKLHARAEEKAIAATRAQIRMLVDAAYYTVLQGGAVLRVARQAVDTRQIFRDQVAVLTTNQLKSELDLSFADSSLAEARVLVSRAGNEERAAQARLAALLGERTGRDFMLLDESDQATGTADVESLIMLALANRPELVRLRLDHDSAGKFAQAERALNYPTITALGAAGVIPEHGPKLPDNYLAGGFNLSLPIFTGLHNRAKVRTAELRVQAVEQTLIEEENNVIRDVRVTWLTVNNAVEQEGLTAKLLETADRAAALADAKYRAGATSIAELAQAQMNQTAAGIARANARYGRLIQQSILDFQIGRIVLPPPASRAP